MHFLTFWTYTLQVANTTSFLKFQLHVLQSAIWSFLMCLNWSSLFFSGACVDNKLIVSGSCRKFRALIRRLNCWCFMISFPNINWRNIYIQLHNIFQRHRLRGMFFVQQVIESILRSILHFFRLYSDAVFFAFKWDYLLVICSLYMDTELVFCHLIYAKHAS